MFDDKMTNDPDNKKENDSLADLFPKEQEAEEMDPRVMEAMDTSILFSDEDIIGIANQI